MEAVLESAEGYDYRPDNLFNALHYMMGARNDAALSVIIGVPHSTISRMRRRLTPVTAEMVMKIHDVSHLSISHIRWLMGDREGYFDPERQRRVVSSSYCRSLAAAETRDLVKRTSSANSP